MRRAFLISMLCAVVLAGGCRSSRMRPPRGARPVERTMLTTGYCRCRKCCGWSRTWYGRPVYASGRLKGRRKKIGLTASGAMATRGTIAADTSRYPFGTVLHVPGYGYGRVEDRGGAIRGDHIDLFFSSHRQAKEWGRKQVTVKIWSQP
ncbi:MAG: 3D domain-containing protein [Lentisphaerae bacterium]|nr:3D domain-containing protein [Lentisphaerota bacterium]